MNNIKIFIVDESAPLIKFLEEGLLKYGNLEILGGSSNFLEARTKIVGLKPDIILCGLRIINNSGLNFIRRMMREHPCKIITISTVNTGKYQALAEGSVSFMIKPRAISQVSGADFLLELISTIEKVHNSPLNRLLGGIVRGNNTLRSPLKKLSMLDEKKDNLKIEGRNDMLLEVPTRKKEMIIAIGASTGGTEALLEVLHDLPESTPGIVLVQHMPPGFTNMFATRLNHICRMAVKEAQNGDSVKQGQVLVAPGDLQMYVIDNGSGYSVRCVPGEKVSGHRPSVDALFHSVAKVAGASSIGVILTGMGGDGANGLLEMKKKGAYTIGQDKESSVVYGMPMVAFKVGAVCKQLPLKEISTEIESHINQK